MTCRHLYVDRARCRGVTLIEILVVVAIILILVTLLTPHLARARGKALRMAASNDITSIETAFAGYMENYRRWPMNLAGNDVPGAEPGANGIVMGAQVVRMLGGENVNGTNPRELPFLTGQQLDAAGAFVDPWGQPYKYMLDFNRDNRLEFNYSGTSTSLNRWIAVWSRGPNPVETPEGQADDIRSW